MSLPTRERGLKSAIKLISPKLIESLPTRERGLKSQPPLLSTPASESLPTRERGLKYLKADFDTDVDAGRSLRGSVD